MRALGIVSAAVIGLVAGMWAGFLIAIAFGGNEGAQEVGTLLGALAGGIGLAVLVARLVPTKPSSLQRGREILKGRDQRVVRWRR